MNLLLESLEQTEQFAKKTADQTLRLFPDEPVMITLSGDLGAGKTTWTQSFGKALGVKRTINSPTFTIMKAYKTGSGYPLYHFDAYRLEGAHQDLGFEESFEQGICVVEWPEFIEEQLPEDRLNLVFHTRADGSREVEISAAGQKGSALLEALG
jgi:tRNA threonylcarbamoyladenosine biosynthesis protein TsaE